MRSSKFFHRPVAGAVAVAVAVGGALLPIAGVSSAAPPAGTLQVTHSTTATATSSALTNLGGGGLPSDLLPSDLLASDLLASDLLPGDPVPGNGVSPTPPKLPDGPLGIPGVMLDAYQRAEQTMADTQPGCHLSWTVLAGIGEIESGHASDGRVDSAGNTLGPILGPRLDGSPGMAAISDTDQGALDGDPVWDRAVGPMQFIPSSWRRHGVHDNGAGAANPNNIYDSTLAAGRYLCTGGADLSDPAQRQAAILRYNHSASYVADVLRWTQAYQTGVLPTPSAPEPVPSVTNGNGGLPVTAAGVPQAPVVAQPAPPAVAQLDAPPAVAQLDAPPAIPPATMSSPPSLDSLTTDSSPTSVPLAGP